MWLFHSNTVPEVENLTLLFQYIGEEQFVVRFVTENGKLKSPRQKASERKTDEMSYRVK